MNMSYPCSILNVGVHDSYKNPQYQTLTDEKKRLYESKTECSIAFEIDGPYRAMVIPTGKEEGKMLKKRYAVFNKDGTLAELKGFELKRRGELKLIKMFQGQVFERFLHGTTLEECYNAVGAVANSW
jgi:DNA polymerase epsilon subunit 1